MKLTKKTHIHPLLKEYPECGEFVYPFMGGILDTTTIGKLASGKNISCEAFISGLERYINRIEQNPCDYKQMRNRLIKPGMVNVAGYTSFLLHDAMHNELMNIAKENHIPLNLNLFPKHEKKQFQNYLAVCNSVNDLPDMLIGKGFSSLNTSRFSAKFILPGYYSHPLKDIPTAEAFLNAKINDSMQACHVFGIEEILMVYDKSINPSIPIPRSWSDILTETCSESLTQMGKPGKDHFGFAMMLYLYFEYGEEGIARYASNIKNKQHFTHTIRSLGRKSDRLSPVNVMHSFAARLIRSDAIDKIHIVETPEGNPAICQFFLIKSSAPAEVEFLARHLFSEPVQILLKKCGIKPASTVNAQPVRWIGWDSLRRLPMPYLKDHLAEIAFKHFKKNEL